VWPVVPWITYTDPKAPDIFKYIDQMSSCAKTEVEMIQDTDA